MPRIVSVLSQKGGVGKTTTAMSLAAVTAERLTPKQRVFLLDVDPQAGSSAYWADTAERMGNPLPFDYDNTTDLDYLMRIRDAHQYDVVFVDTPGSLENMQVITTVAERSDYVIMPTDASALALRSLAETIQKVIGPLGTPYKILLNRIASARRQELREAVALLGRNNLAYFDTPVRDYAAHSRAAGQGLVVTQYPKGRDTRNAIDDYQSVAREMWQDWARMAEAQKAGTV